MRIAVVGCRETKKVAKDEALFHQALMKRGHQVEVIPWEDLKPDHSCDLAVIRTVWNYVEKFEEFQKWLPSMRSASFRILNSLDTIEWNINKKYLLELQQKGVRIPTSLIWEREFLPNWIKLEEALGPAPFVFKPIISAGARGTYLVHGDVSYSAVIDRIRHKPLIAQEYLREVKTGEYSAMVFGGEFSHAVLKTPQPGDFRVQTDFGGSVSPTELDKDLITWAENVAGLAPGKPPIARVDFVLHREEPYLMELEVFEPELFFRFDPKSPERLASALLSVNSPT
jgi:glutathione synthase/RimK-type ligase-like ATP-grasp enzyme